MEIGKKVWAAFLLGNAALIVWFWSRGSGAFVTEGVPEAMIGFGGLTGLLAAYAILLQFFFMGRLPFLERVFGQDRLSRLHRVNGKIGLSLILLHPVLLTLGHALMTGAGIKAQFLDFFRNYEHVDLAVFGLSLFVIVVLTSIVVVRSRLRYESWYAVHLFAYLAVFASFWHQLAVGSDLLASRAFYAYWVLLYVLVFASHLAFRILRPLWLYGRHLFRVSRVVRETDHAVSIYVGGRNLERFPIRPGQFMILRFLAPGFWWQAHPFSLSRPSDGRELRITVKALGDFTREIENVPPGAPVMIDGPYGVFTDRPGVSEKVLFVAGGIGITPIRSLAEDMLRKGKDVVLLYSNRTEQDIVFKEEFASLSGDGSLRVRHVLTDAPGGGRFDAAKIKELVPDAAVREVFLCGPPPMMKAVRTMLAELGVPRSRIHFEEFSF